MPPTSRLAATGRFERAVQRGLAFLAERQLPSGQFATYMGRDLGGGDAAFDSSPFVTALVVRSIGTSQRARVMVERAVGFLRSQMEPPGVWRYWTFDHPGHAAIPPDVDDTACISEVLRLNGIAPPDNRGVLLANRDRRGRFYTWIAPRWTPPPRDRGYWRAVAPRLRAPIRSRRFWRDNHLSARDVSCVVNANVLLYLGDGPAAAPVTRWLVDLMRERREGRCDGWYLGPHAFYYSVARCIEAGIRGLDAVRDDIVERIVASARKDASLGANALETALAACTLRRLGGSDTVLDRACAHLVASQGESGSWPIAPIYHGGPPDDYRWGSEELTTGFCVEALLTR